MSNPRDNFELALQTFSTLQTNSNARQILGYIKSLGKSDPEIAECEGAYFAKSDHDGAVFHLNLIGTMPRDKRQSCSKFVQEKLHRVCLLAVYTDHTLSRHSVDRAIERYPGAVLGTHYAHSISGFPGLVDEMGACAWALLDGDLTKEQAVERTKDNKYFDMLEGLFWLAPNPI